MRTSTIGFVQGKNLMSQSRIACVWIAVAGMLPIAALQAAPDALVAKQLAGPPEDFAQMASLTPDATAIHSKSALLPIELALTGDGFAAWSGDLPVEKGRLHFAVLSADDAAWQVSLQSPTAQVARAAASLASASGRTELGIENDRHSADYYALDDVESGRWRVDIRASASGSRRGFLLVEGDAATELTSYQTHRRQWPGQSIGLVAMLSGESAKGEATLGGQAGRIDRAELRVTAPDGSVRVLPMFDDGAHSDQRAGDSVFGGEFLTGAAGDYIAQVRIDGRDAAGRALVRTSEHIIPVVEQSVSLAGALATGRDDSQARGRVLLDIPVMVRAPGQHYRAFAEVWGTDARGRSVAVAWLGGMIDPGANTLALGLDTRWITRAGARAPFELRALRIEDPDHFVTLAESARLPLALPTTVSDVSVGLRSNVVIDDDMRMGIKPAVLDQRAGEAVNGVGQRLLLVHGYCSGGVWPAAQFTTDSTFLDVNQNRSHDQFARLIQSFGATWNSFGIVAHSQGGPAALHLYNYYWSGLDNATGSRLIQSVGSPYKGTNLAGILASLGSWFGVGCGTNDNLSYSGSASWLAGIPNSSRAKVNYYTTAFRSTNWWTNDYCNFATDLVLSDPEDGTTEKVNGQLSGAVNRGHVDGQCHTTGMRDPAQYLNASRNATMNTNAAR